MDLREKKQYVIIDNVAGTYRHHFAKSLGEVVAEVNRTHQTYDDSKPVAIDDLIGIPPRYQIVPVTECYSLYE